MQAPQNRQVFKAELPRPNLISLLKTAISIRFLFILSGKLHKFWTNIMQIFTKSGINNIKFTTKNTNILNNLFP
jgi:hypothetical protein